MGAYIAGIVDNAAEQASLWPGKVFFGQWNACPSDYPGTISDNPGYDDFSPFPNDEMITVEKGDNRVGSFLHADDMVGIEVHLLFVHAREKNHGAP